MNRNDEKEPQQDAERKEEPLDENVAHIEQLRQEATEFKNKYLHALADSENARKRLQKDREEMIQYSMRNLIIDFLSPIDHMENALKYTEEASQEVKHWAAGFKMILNQFKDVLAGNGVKPMVSIGKPFDPHLHEAVEMVETEDYPPGVVVEEHVRGYLMSEKTLRPARVKVSKTPQSSTTEEN